MPNDRSTEELAQALNGVLRMHRCVALHVSGSASGLDRLPRLQWPLRLDNQPGVIPPSVSIEAAEAPWRGEPPIGCHTGRDLLRFTASRRLGICPVELLAKSFSEMHTSVLVHLACMVVAHVCTRMCRSRTAKTHGALGLHSTGSHSSHFHDAPETRSSCPDCGRRHHESSIEHPRYQRSLRAAVDTHSSSSGSRASPILAHALSDATCRLLRARRSSPRICARA